MFWWAVSIVQNAAGFRVWQVSDKFVYSLGKRGGLGLPLFVMCGMWCGGMGGSFTGRCGGSL